MVIRRRLFVMMAVMGVASLLVLLLFWLLLQRNMSSIMADRNKSAHRTFECIIGLEGQVMKSLAYDYKYWTEMVDFVSSGDEVWAVQNLDAALESFKCDACWVLKADFSMVTYRMIEGVTLEEGDLEVETCRVAFEREKFPHWFSRIGEDVVEFRAAPIQPSIDAARETPAQGYFVVARIWNADRVAALQDIFGATRVELVDAGGQLEAEGEHSNVGCSSHAYELPSANGKSSLSLQAELCSPGLDHLIQLNGFASVAVSIMMVLTVAFFAIGLTVWVSVPIILMSEALEKKDPSLVKSLVTQKNEIGRLASLIGAFFRQRDELEQEIAHRKDIQAKQEKLSSILRIWGSCNFAIATSPSEEAMLDRVCRIIVDVGKYRAVWIGDVKWSGNKACVKPISFRGDDGGYLELAKKGLLEDAMKSKCLIGDALSTSDVAVCRGIDDSSRACRQWERGAAKCGLKSAACFPMMHQGEVFALLTIFSSEAADLDVEERKVLTEVIENLSAGILLRRSEQARTSETKAADLSEQLLRTQKLEAVGRLAGGIAHDFNNLLFVIMGNLELALGDGADTANRAELTEAMEASKQAANLTKQLLALGRKRVAVAKPIDVNAEIKKALELMKSALKENVDVRLNLDDKVGLLLGDPLQIRQVFMNLAINAGEAMPKGGTFTISTENVCVESDFAPEALPGDYVLIGLTDTGVGMDESTLEHAFEPFFTTKEEGAGLGLSLVNSIIAQHDGFVRMSSVKGAGTTFRVFLPIADVLPGGEVEVASMEVLRAKPGDTLLLVEDRDMCRMLTKTMLQSLGYAVIDAAYGKQALELVKEGTRIDVVLTDVVMPGMSGPEMILQLREKGMTARVVYMSGYADGVLAEHGLAGTRVGLLQKPFILAQLAQIIREAMTKG